MHRKASTTTCTRPVLTDRVDVVSGYLASALVDVCFVCGGAEVAQCGVSPAGVVPALDPVEDRLVGGGPGGPGRRSSSSVLMVAKNDSATALSQHWPRGRPRAGRRAGRPGAGTGRWCTGSRGRSGRSPRGRAAAGHRVGQGLVDQVGAQVVGGGPADHPARGEVDDGGQVQPALPGVDVGDVAAPAGVEPPRWRWRSPARSGPRRGRRPGRARSWCATASGPAAPPGGAHQPGDALAAVPRPWRSRRAPGGRRRCRSDSSWTAMIASVSSASSRSRWDGPGRCGRRRRRSGRPSAAHRRA